VAAITVIKSISLAVILGLIMLTASACGGLDEETIEKNSSVFENDNIPQELITELQDKKAIVAGELHSSQEHQMLLAALAVELHQEGELDAVVLDSRHAYSWIIEDYVRGELDDGAFLQEIIDNRRSFLQEIREYNQERESEDELIVRSGDINFQHDQFLSSLQFMRRYIENGGSLNHFLNQLRSASDREQVMRNYKEELEEEELQGAWDRDWNERVMRMIEVELDSREPREKWQTDYTHAHELREEALKRIASWNLNENREILFNYGFNHAQKEHHFGTEKEWLGEFISSNHPISGGASYNFIVMPLQGQIRTREGDIENIDIVTDPPEDEIISYSSEVLGEDQPVFINFAEDFISGEVTFDLHYQQVEAVPGEIYDGIIILPEVSVEN